MAERRWPLDDLDGPVWDLPPAPVIRRRGDARRRRRTVLQFAFAAAGTAAALALPAVLVAGHSGPGGGPVTPAAGARPSTSSTQTGDGEPRAGTWRDTVPAGFGIVEGMGTDGAPPVVTGPDGDSAVRRDVVCGEARWAWGLPGAATDAVVATREGDPGVNEHRVLLVYPDDTSAHQAFDGVQRRASTCGEGLPDQEASISTDVGGPAADESWALVVTGGTTDGVDGAIAGTQSVLAVRVGNAVLLDRTSASSTRPQGSSVADWLADRATPVIDEMCVFAADPC